MEVASLEEPGPPQKAQPTPAVPFTAVSTTKVPRSSERISLRVPVVIYGYAGKCGAFHEDAETVIVNYSGALVTLKTKLAMDDNVFLGLAFKKTISDFWRRNRKKSRVPKTLRVLVKGTDHNGHPFTQSAYTVDLSQDGARLDGVGFLTSPGQTIEVRRRWRQARFRVVWIGQVGTTETNQIGVFRLQSEKDIWRIELPKTGAVPLPRR